MDVQVRDADESHTENTAHFCSRAHVTRVCVCVCVPG